MNAGRLLLALICYAPIGWSASGVEDLVQAGSWDCASGVSYQSGKITVQAGSGFNTVINTSGALLKVAGDFSVRATYASPQLNNVFLTLVGTLNTGEWWNGLKRLDVGTGAVNYWTGASSTATAQAIASSSAADSTTIEVSRIGAQIVVSVNGLEASRFDDPGLFASGQVYLGFNVAPQSSMMVTALSASGGVSLSAPWTVTVPRTNGIRESASKAGFYVGAAVNPSLLTNPAYAQTLGSQFNMVVAENAMKFAPTEPARGQYNFCQADQVVAFAQANGMAVRGHNLVWQQSNPAWLTGGGYSAAEAASILQAHIANVAGHFKGKVVLWDVVNEAIAYGAPYGPQPSYWLSTIGPDYVDKAFRWAHEADPGAKLFYNDTGGEGLGPKSDAVFNLVQGLLNRGVPLNGVGLQMHVSLTGAPSAASIAANIKRLADLGLEVQITEMDVRLPASASSSDLIAQANIYNYVAGACLANSSCTALLTWGVSDANSWIPGSYPGFGNALLFNDQFQAKPAASGLVSAMNAALANPRVFFGGAVIHGSSSTVVSPGSLVDLYGSGLSAGAPVLASGAALPLVLGGVQVAVDSAPVPVLYESNGLAIFQMPWEAKAGRHSVVVFSNGLVSAPLSVTVQDAAPAILTYGANRAVALNPDLTVNSSSNCASPGGVAVVYAMGSGPVDNAVSTGALAPLAPLSRETLNTTVLVNGAPALVKFAGLAPSFVGLVQVNFEVPVTKPGDGTLQLGIGAMKSNVASFCVTN